MSIYRVEFLDGPLKGAHRLYDRRPPSVCQPIGTLDENGNPGLQFVYEYDVASVPTLGAYTARQKAMWIMDGWRKTWSQASVAARDFGPSRDAYNDLMRPQHRRQLLSFIVEYNALLEKHGVEVDHHGGYGECEGVDFVIGSTRLSERDREDLNRWVSEWRELPR